MSLLPPGTVDCDVHLPTPRIEALMPYLEPHWRDALVTRGVDAMTLAAYPPGAPLSCRPDWRSAPGTPLEALQRRVLDDRGVDAAICNCLHGAMALPGDDMAAAMIRAVNDWMAAEWLARDTRLRGSIMLPSRSPAQAAAEIDRLGPDRRFVQAMMLVSGAMPLGRRDMWPVYEAATRHDLPVAIHPGSAMFHPTTPSGWPSFYVEDYVGQAQALQNQLASLLAEGVFVTFPTLRVVLAESGLSWLPSFLMRADKTWRGLRIDAPWLEHRPSHYVRRHVRLTLQPVDAPADPADLQRLLALAPFDELLLFASDDPHWHFEGDAVLPPALGAAPAAALVQRIAVDNPRETYPRLR